MGTTFVAATIVNEELLVANVGDSRLYVLHDGQLRQITLDHSLVEEMVRTGSMSQEMAYHHPKKHMITRAVGQKIRWISISLMCPCLAMRSSFCARTD